MTQTLHGQTTDDGVRLVRFDRPERSINTFTPDVLDELEREIDVIEADLGDIAGVVFASDKTEGFIAGADLFELAEMDPTAARQFLERGQMLFERIAHLPMPTVAAINGHCLGGGMELALACRARVAVDDGTIRLGLPETKIGLVPGWGGTTRVTEMLGPVAAMKLLLPGSTCAPRKMQRYRLIDEVVRPEALLAAAMRLAHHPPEPIRPPWTTHRLLRVPAARRALFHRARRQTHQRTGGHYPAADALIEIVQRVVEDGHDAGLEAERTALTELFTSDAARNLLRLFFLRQNAKEVAQQAAPQAPRDVKRAAVIGGGTMGAGIAHALVTAGVPVRLIEVDHSAVAAALRRIERMIDDDRREGRLTRLQAEQAMRRVSPSIAWRGLELADVAIEAVAEKPAVKRAVFAKLGELTRPGTVLATNTSALDVAEMARAAGRPGRVIGMHFFNPVPKMLLIEIVRTPDSDGEAVATGVALARELGKTPIVVGNGPAFLVNRLVLPQLAEALHLIGEGVSPGAIDRAMRRWGMPMGPCELLDHVGLDVTVDILEALKPRLGERFVVPDGLAEAVERGWLGRKSGRGFYVYSTGWRKAWRGGTQPNEPLLRRLRGVNERATGGEAMRESDDTQIQRRLVLPMVNEAARVLIEGVTDSTDTIDLATVLGLGFAPFRGGLVRHAEATGLNAVVSQMRELAEHHGERFEPVPELVRIAEQGRAMQELASHAIALRREASKAQARSGKGMPWSE